MESPPPISNAPVDRIIKILILGNPKCGKSSLIARFVRDTFDDHYKSTVGADFLRKDLIVKPKAAEASLKIRLQLWDIAGQDRFQKITRAYFNGAKGIAIVCDVSREGTVEAVKTWKEEVDRWIVQSGCSPDIPVVLFANKADLLSNAMEACKTGAVMERVCREQGFLGWFVTSAKNGDYVEEGFNELVSRILEMEAGQSSSEAKQPSKGETAKNSFRLQPPSNRRLDEKSLYNIPADDGSCFS